LFVLDRWVVDCTPERVCSAAFVCSTSQEIITATPIDEIKKVFFIGFMLKLVKAVPKNPYVY
jgi:hypothetical protein